MICISVIKGFNQPRAAGSEITVSADKTMLPDANLLAERKLLGDMKSIKSLKQSGISGVFTGQAVSTISFLVSPFVSASFLQLKCRVCAEQNGGPAH